MFRLTFFPVYWLSLLFAINGILPSFSETVCGEAALDKCSDVLRTVLQNPDIVFPENDDDIETSCRYFNQYMNCVENMANKCYKGDGRVAFLGIFSGMMSLLSDMCTEGSTYRAKVLKYGPCFRSLEDELLGCVNKYTEKGNALKTAEMSTEEKLRESCCYVDTATECFLVPIMETCGKEAVDLMKQATQKIYGPLTQICSSVGHDSSSCSTASSITISGVLLFLSMIIMNLKQ